MAVSDVSASIEIAPNDAVKTTERMSPAASLVLDVVRFTAAVTVVLGHFSLSLYSAGMHNFMPAASGAVGVFFVLSGFVIRYVTRYRATTLPEYLLDRASRLFSVVLPALAFTVVAELIGRHLGYSASIPVGEYLLRILTSLTFTSQVWFQDLAPRWNGPFWSLSYEAFYYVLYGIAFYLRGPKRIALFALACLLAGPGIVFLAPLWFFGAWLQDVYQRVHRSWRQSVHALGGVFAGVAAVGVLLAASHALRHTVRAFLHDFSIQMELWHMQKASPWYYETGIPCGIALFCALLLLHRVPLPHKSKLVRVVRFVADGTFAVYLFHLPMINLVRALVPYDHTRKVHLAAVFLFVVTVSMLLERPCLMLKNLIRTRFAPLVEQV